MQKLLCERSVYLLGKQILDTNKPTATFYMMHLDKLQQLYQAWQKHIPLVRPYYAIKCNPDENIVRLLAKLGCGFDCASMAEIETVLQCSEVNAKRDVIFANPAKIIDHIHYAKNKGVHMTTFDSPYEIEKLHEHYPTANCLLRIVIDNPDAKCRLGAKYGATQDEAKLLLQKAKQLRIDVCGVAFHIGSGGKNYKIMNNAMQMAYNVMMEGTRLGMDMRMVDIGGGFTPDATEPAICMDSMSSSINNAIDRFFPNSTFEGRSIDLIAEPGRFFAESTTTIFTPVYSRRERNGKQELWIMEGMYGAFNCIIYDHQIPSIRIGQRKREHNDAKMIPTTIWGPTCDSFDCVYKDIELPHLDVGDWLAFPNAGAYTIAGACDFNGIRFTNPLKYYLHNQTS